MPLSMNLIFQFNGTVCCSGWSDGSWLSYFPAPIPSHKTYWVLPFDTKPTVKKNASFELFTHSAG